MADGVYGRPEDRRAIAAAAGRAGAEDGALRAAPVVTATLSGDHRASDGHRGARFLAALREQLQRPEEL